MEIELKLRHPIPVGSLVFLTSAPIYRFLLQDALISMVAGLFHVMLYAT
jgi:hypothetical protein